MKKITLLGVLGILCLQGIGQTIKPLSIGDIVPDIKLLPIPNYPVSQSNFSQLKNKLIILDFMNTGCASCIAALPRLDSLQKKYGDQLQIFLVTSQPEAQVQSFLKRKNIINLHLPIIAEDTLLSQLFPHQLISHIVWIGADKKVKAITYSEYVTSDNVSLILEGKTNTWPVKIDVDYFDHKKPLLVYNNQLNGGKNVSHSYSALFSYLAEIGRYLTIERDSITHTIRKTIINQPRLGLFLQLLNRPSIAPTQIVLDVKDKDQFIYDVNKFYRREWEDKNTYSFESVLPDTLSIQEINRKMLRDLGNYLNTTARLEKRSMKCLLISKNKNKERKVSNKKGSDSYSLEALVYQLNKNYGGMPVLSDASLNKNIIPIRKEDLTNLTIAKKILLENGYELRYTTKQFEVVFISDK